MIKFLVVFPPFVWLMLSASFYAGGEYFSKLWAISPTVSISFQVLVCYSFAALTWLPALLHKNQITIMGASWLLLATLVTVIIGFFVFSESLTSLHWLGVGLACTAMVLLSS
jgi:multidrug transporter EmrE-like cation transporter